jgi:S1-C subfamily serine protease
LPRHSGGAARLSISFLKRLFVANADKVTVIFQDDSRHAAKVVGRDEKADIALVKIDANENLT